MNRLLQDCYTIVMWLLLQMSMIVRRTPVTTMETASINSKTTNVNVSMVLKGMSVRQVGGINNGLFAYRRSKNIHHHHNNMREYNYN